MGLEHKTLVVKRLLLGASDPFGVLLESYWRVIGFDIQTFPIQAAK